MRAKLVAALVLCCAVSAQAEAGGLARGKWALGYAQRYVTFGRDLNLGDAIVYADVSADWGESGLFGGLWCAFGVESRGTWDEWDEYDPYLGYRGTAFAGDRYALDYELTYSFLYFPRIKASLGNQDYHQWVLALRLPALLPEAGGGRWTPYASLYYDHGTAPGARAWIDETVLKLGLESVFAENTGAGAYNSFLEVYYNDGQRTGDHPGWSHALGGLRYALDWRGFRLTPGLYYQWSREPSIAPDNLFWMSFQISRDF